MALPIIKKWNEYFTNHHEGLGSSYERVILNRKIYSICRHYNYRNILEAPSFGFTGISGINSVYLAKRGIKVTQLDHNLERINLIKELWSSLNLHCDIDYTQDYKKLEYPDDCFDLSWNFSALWFVQDLQVFLSELTRITKSAIFICVPNVDGIGFKQQMKTSKDLSEINLAYIDKKGIVNQMQSNGWRLVDDGYIDCPPWPDIGMNKEDFLVKNCKVCQVTKYKPSIKKELSILDYYQGKDYSFCQRMMKYSFVENTAPNIFKKYWAHHFYMLFLNPKE